MLRWDKGVMSWGRRIGNAGRKESKRHGGEAGRHIERERAHIVTGRRTIKQRGSDGDGEETAFGGGDGIWRRRETT
jgi:hypothetical protein